MTFNRKGHLEIYKIWPFLTFYDNCSGWVADYIIFDTQYCAYMENCSKNFFSDFVKKLWLTGAFDTFFSCVLQIIIFAHITSSPMKIWCQIPVLFQNTKMCGKLLRKCDFFAANLIHSIFTQICQFAQTKRKMFAIDSLFLNKHSIIIISSPYMIYPTSKMWKKRG